MQKFEQDVNESHGCWLYFDKLPPPEDEDPKKKPTAKGKANVEEIKPVHGRVWIDLTPLLNPGVKSTPQTSVLI